MSLDGTDPTDFEGIDFGPVLPPCVQIRKDPRSNAATGASAAGVRAFTAQAVAFYFRAPVKAFFRTRVDYLVLTSGTPSVVSLLTDSNRHMRKQSVQTSSLEGRHGVPRPPGSSPMRCERTDGSSFPSKSSHLSSQTSRSEQRFTRATSRSSPAYMSPRPRLQMWSSLHLLRQQR
jgi:hypothetical protein